MLWISFSCVIPGGRDAFIFLRGQASSPYNFHMQCPISTKALINVDSLALNTSTQPYKVGHFEFCGLFEMLPYIILSCLPTTDWTPQTSQSVSILLGPCHWHTRKIFILCHTYWPWWCHPVKSFLRPEASSPRNFTIQCPICPKSHRNVEGVTLNISLHQNCAISIAPPTGQRKSDKHHPTDMMFTTCFLSSITWK